jgi:metal-responsive CopG/Arc/MetJ family transcriptional regulator
MKTRKYTQGITLFTTPEMYHEVKRVSDETEVSLSELFREMITEYLRNHKQQEEKVNE